MLSSHLRLLFLACLCAFLLLILLLVPDLVRAGWVIAPTPASGALTTAAVMGAEGEPRGWRTTDAVVGALQHKPRQYMVERVTIDGPVSGIIDRSSMFTATAVFSPIIPTGLVTLTWQATQQTPISTTDTSEDVATFVWDTPGTKMITVTAQSGTLQVSATHTIDISAPPTALAIDGPAVGALHRAQQFVAAALPNTTTLPITYTWEASGMPRPQQRVVDASGGLTSVVSFTWNVIGSQVVTVSAANDVGIVTVTHQIDIRVPPQVLSMSAPITGIINTSYDVVATVEPLTTTTPLHYVWRTDDSSALMNHQVTTNTTGLSDTLVVAWDERGVQMVTATVTNESGHATDSRAVIVTAAPPDATSILVTPQGGEKLVSSNKKVQIVFAEGSVKEPAVAIYTYLPPDELKALPAGLITLYGFELEAYTVNGSGLPVACCDPPSDATIQYNRSEVSDVTLRLLAWNGSAWVDVPSIVNTGEQQVLFDLDRMTSFVLVGQEQDLVFLPLIGG